MLAGSTHHYSMFGDIKYVLLQDVALQMRCRPQIDAGSGQKRTASKDAGQFAGVEDGDGALRLVGIICTADVGVLVVDAVGKVIRRLREILRLHLCCDGPTLAQEVPVLKCQGTACVQICRSTVPAALA